MLCRIADLYVEVPEGGGMAPRLRDYVAEEQRTPDITVREEGYDESRFPDVSAEAFPYLHSGWLFYSHLYLHGGMMLHASGVELGGRAYLFSGPSGIGKSTHTREWEKQFSARIFNDDKPAIRQIDGVWYAYGTPWCGKDGININLRAPLAGICFLRRGAENSIRRLSVIEAVAATISQTNNRFKTEKGLDRLTDIVEKLTAEVPFYELSTHDPEAAARLSHETMIVR